MNKKFSFSILALSASYFLNGPVIAEAQTPSDVYKSQSEMIKAEIQRVEDTNAVNNAWNTKHKDTVSKMALYLSEVTKERIDYPAFYNVKPLNESGLREKRQQLVLHGLKGLEKLQKEQSMESLLAFEQEILALEKSIPNKLDEEKKNRTEPNQPSVRGYVVLLKDELARLKADVLEQQARAKRASEHYPTKGSTLRPITPAQEIAAMRKLEGQINSTRDTELACRGGVDIRLAREALEATKLDLENQHRAASAEVSALQASFTAEVSTIQTDHLNRTRQMDQARTAKKQVASAELNRKKQAHLSALGLDINNKKAEVLASQDAGRKLPGLRTELSNLESEKSALESIQDRKGSTVEKHESLKKIAADIKDKEFANIGNDPFGEKPVSQVDHDAVTALQTSFDTEKTRLVSEFAGKIASKKTEIQNAEIAAAKEPALSAQLTALEKEKTEVEADRGRLTNDLTAFHTANETADHEFNAARLNSMATQLRSNADQLAKRVQAKTKQDSLKHKIDLVTADIAKHRHCEAVRTEADTLAHALAKPSVEAPAGTRHDDHINSQIQTHEVIKGKLDEVTKALGKR